MKKIIKGIVLGVIITTMLMTTALGAQVKKTIEVVYNSVNLTVNGSKVNADNILYEGTTYVPLRAVAEALGKDVGWDQATTTASVNDKGTVAPTIPVSKDGVKVYEDEKIKLSYLQVIDKGVEFMLQNKTDITLMIQADALALNGLNTSEYIGMSLEVSPQSKGKVLARFDTKDYKGQKIETVSGTFNIFNFDHMEDYNIKATFVNIKVN